MPPRRQTGKFLPAVYPDCLDGEVPDSCPALEGGTVVINGLALAIFIALFAWGASYFGWSDPDGKVQLALFTTFVLGVAFGYKTK